MVRTLEKLKALKKFLNEPSPKHWKNETDDVKYNKGKTLQLPNKCSLGSYSIKTCICFQKDCFAITCKFLIFKESFI